MIMLMFRCSDADCMMRLLLTDVVASVGSDWMTLTQQSTIGMTRLCQHSFLNPLRLRVAKLLVLEAIFIGLIVLVKFIAKSITFLPNQNLQCKSCYKILFLI